MNTKHSNDSKGQLLLPKRLGIAADLCFSVPDHVGYLADCLLTHDSVVIPLNHQTLNRLEAAFDSPALFELIKNQKIVFCHNTSPLSSKNLDNSLFDRERYVAEVREGDLFRNGSDRPALFSEITRSFVDPISRPDAGLIEALKQVDEAFDFYSIRPGYKFLFPRDEGILAPGRHYFLVGALTGVTRISNLVSSGILGMEMDAELPMLLELCFPIKREAGVEENALRYQAQKIILDLHKIQNLPSFEIKEYRPILRDQDDISKIVNLILSDESQNLRDWLQSNIKPDLDVRAAYDRADKLLPSKSQWSGWMRFGATTGLGTLAGLLLPDPLIGAAAGAGIGLIDQAIGGKATETLDTYHPKVWLTQMSKLMPSIVN
ncbi:hypothetical protein [Pseudomonas viridiflava]|uniref:hypothetical protein n=1 Tax=Pseudomonas viridiflava TaxID=33069 RepID=UPI0010FAC442|nr:hypothetical protein [Pseudomonas viridiflava]